MDIPISHVKSRPCIVKRTSESVSFDGEIRRVKFFDVEPRTVQLEIHRGLGVEDWIYVCLWNIRLVCKPSTVYRKAIASISCVRLRGIVGIKKDGIGVV